MSEGMGGTAAADDAPVARGAPADRLDDYALVWLLLQKKKPTPSDLGRVIKGFAAADQAPIHLANEVTARLKQRGFVQERPLALTAEGRARALSALGVQEWTGRGGHDLRWAKKVLALRALGIPINNGTLKSPDWTACALAWRYDLERGSSKSLSTVVSLLAWRALGRNSAAPFGLDSAFVAILGRGEGPPSSKSGDHGSNGTRAEPARAEPSLADAPLPEFAEAVLDAARGSKTGNWHGMTFISHVWSELARRHDVGMAFEEFGKRLVKAHQNGSLVLCRADLVEAMPPADVRASEIEHFNARFHFVRLD